ncbi:MAG: hypothetical protein K8R46_03115 [Pirellulales bacterium]|nr:hypothetical protein [Pirellulales bacterium]
MSKWVRAIVRSAISPREDLVLAGLDPPAKLLFGPTVAGDAGAGHVQQRTLNMMIGVLHPALGAIRHVAVGAGDTAEGVNARPIDLVIRMLHLDHPRLADGVRPIGEICRVVVLFHVLGRGPLVPGERQVIALALEVILDVALCADQSAHLLVRRLIDVLSLARERLAQRRPGNAQPHGVRLVAIETADRMGDFRLQRVEVRRVEFVDTHRVHQPRHIGTFTRPAGGRRLVVYTFRIRHVLDGVDVSPRLPILLGEAVSGEKDDVGGCFGQIVARQGPAVLRARGRIFHPLVGFVFARVVFAPLGAVGFPLPDRSERQSLSGLLAALDD